MLPRNVKVLKQEKNEIHTRSHYRYLASSTAKKLLIRLSWRRNLVYRKACDFASCEDRDYTSVKTPKKNILSRRRSL